MATRLVSAIKDRLLEYALESAPEFAELDLTDQATIPALAHDAKSLARLHFIVERLPSAHQLWVGDARRLEGIADESVQLVVTSPPYWTLKKYRESVGQLGDVTDYDEFNHELAKAWRECHRVLTPGGRLVVVVGDVCLSRRAYGRHVVYPLHATIQEACRSIGFDNLAPIIWHKIANAQYEAGGGGFLGKPYEPNAIIKNDIEYILMQRKPGGYRSPTPGMRLLSVLSVDEQREWFQQIWTLPGASTKEHPAPFPLTLADRLVRMFSFVGDVVLDPFAGTGTVMLACAQAGRNSFSYEIDPVYADMVERRFRSTVGLLSRAELTRGQGKIR